MNPTQWHKAPKTSPSPIKKQHTGKTNGFHFSEIYISSSYYIMNNNQNCANPALEAQLGEAGSGLH